MTLSSQESLEKFFCMICQLHNNSFCLKVCNKAQAVTIFTLFLHRKIWVIQMLENICQVCQHYSIVRRFKSIHKETLLFLQKLFNYHFALQKPCQTSTSGEPPDVYMKQQNRSIIIKITVECFKQPVIQNFFLNIIYSYNT